MHRIARNIAPPKLWRAGRTHRLPWLQRRKKDRAQRQRNGISHSTRKVYRAVPFVVVQPYPTTTAAAVSNLGLSQASTFTELLGSSEP